MRPWDSRSVSGARALTQAWTAIGAASIVIAAAACHETGTSPPPTPRLHGMVIVSGNGQTGEVGTALTQPVVIKLTDSLGSPVAGRAIRFDGDVDAPGDSLFTDSLGIFSAHWILGGSAGLQRLDVVSFEPTRPYYERATFSATALAGPPALIKVLAGDSAVVLPSTQLDTITIQVTDRFGNPAQPSTSVAWSVAAGGGSVVPLGAQIDGKGVARAVWTVGPAAGPNTLAVRFGDLAGQVSAVTTGPLSAAALSVGYDHTCALSGVAAYCWGLNGFGQLGSGTSENQLRRNPVRVVGNISFVSLASGDGQTCGVTAVGDAYCWGLIPGVQQNGPTRVSGAPAFTALVLGHAHACGLTTSGGILCWGSNAQGQLGDGTFTDRAAPAPVKTDVTFMSLAAGYSFTCGLSTTGDAYCWGTDAERELVGAGVRSCTVPGYYGELIAVSCSNVPVRIEAATRLTSLAASVVASCGLTTDLQALCWGHGLNGPQLAAGSLQFSTIAVGSSDACGLETSGRISCWSLDASSAQFMTPQPVAAGVAFATLSAQASSYCGVARPAPNVAYCWGNNGYGQLGDGTKQDRNAPVPVVAPLVP